MLESEEVTYPGVTAVDVSKIMYIAGATSWTSSTITYERWPLEGPRSYDHSRCHVACKQEIKCIGGDTVLESS